MDLSRPWRDYTYVSFDTETSGKYPLVAEVVEVAAVKWQNGKVIDTFQSLVKPHRLMGEAVIRIHHITNEMVAGAPLMPEVLPQFDAFIKDSVLMAHHAAFDLGFLTLEYEKLNLPLPNNVVLDSCLLSLKAFPNLPNHRLATLVNALGVKMNQAHRALEDSKACLEVSLRCMETLGGLATLEFIALAQGGMFEWPRFSMNDLLSRDLTRPLVQGSEKQWVLEITYQGGRQAGEPRRITPQGLVRSMGGDYVVGFCHRDLIEKRFYLSRISSVKVLD
jgi:DNA polymerase-3 subunit epsilon